MTLYIKSVLRDALIVYGLTFAFGAGLAIADLNMQNSPYTAYLTNLLSGALGFTVASIRISSHRIEYAVWVAVTFWTINLTNIVLGLQTYASWIHSGVTIILMAVLGCAFAGMVSLLSRPIPSHSRPISME